MKQKLQNKEQKSTKKTMLLVINIVIVCFLGFVMYEAYSPIPKLLHQTKNTVTDTPTAPTTTAMVQRNGTQLMLGDEPFHVVGVNAYDLAYKSNDDIDQTFELLSKAGVTTIRFWLFGDGRQDGFQPQAGVMNEERFAQADYVLYDAAQYHIKVIPVLVNNWTDYGGKDQYIRWVGKDPTTDEDSFYTDTQIRSLFQNYITHVLSRKNNYSNITYADDPTILGWDIMNEPRSTDQSDMNNWLTSMASFIKQHDPHHLIFAGTEVATINSNEGKSSDLCADPSIDICSVHLYLFNNSQPIYTSYADVTTFIQSQAEYAKQVNKPILLEEFGIAQDTKPFGQDQLPVMQQLIETSKQDDYAGYLIWDWSNTQNSTFTFSPNGDSSGDYSLSDLKKLLK